MRWQILAGLVIMTMPDLAMGQVSGLPGGIMPAGPGSAQDQYQRFEQHQEQLDALPPPSGDIDLHKPASPAQGSRGCATIHSITVEGISRLSQADIGNMTQPHVGSCMTVRDLNSLIDALNAAYVQQ